MIEKDSIPILFLHTGWTTVFFLQCRISSKDNLQKFKSAAMKDGFSSKKSRLPTAFLLQVWSPPASLGRSASTKAFRVLLRKYRVTLVTPYPTAGHPEGTMYRCHSIPFTTTEPSRSRWGVQGSAMVKAKLLNWINTSFYCSLWSSVLVRKYLSRACAATFLQKVHCGMRGKELTEWSCSK